jgi:hypothetical protein
MEFVCFCIHKFFLNLSIPGAGWLLMVILDDNIVSTSIFPAKADAPLLVNSDAELAFSVTFECFESVRRRDAEIVDVNRLIEHRKLVQSPLLNLRRQFARQHQGPQSLCLFISKAFYHNNYTTTFPLGVNSISAQRK